MHYHHILPSLMQSMQCCRKASLKTCLLCINTHTEWQGNGEEKRREEKRMLKEKEEEAEEMCYAFQALHSFH